jgi:hypothetical protein
MLPVIDFRLFRVKNRWFVFCANLTCVAFGQVPLDGVDASKFNDAYFAKIKAKKTKTADGEPCLYVFFMHACLILSTLGSFLRSTAFSRAAGTWSNCRRFFRHACSLC